MADTNSALVRFGERYSSNATVRALLQLVPAGAGAAVDTLISVRLDNIRQARLQAFLDEIAARFQNMPKEILESDEFVHAFVRTSEAALRTHHTEKIRLFARLIAAGMGREQIAGIDEFEESLAILDELSFREWSLLVLLQEFEEANPADVGNPFVRAKSFWPEFTKEAITRLSLRADEFDPALIRLTRTGCYETFSRYCQELWITP